jgi:hypothetical protein
MSEFFSDVTSYHDRRILGLIDQVTSLSAASLIALWSYAHGVDWCAVVGGYQSMSQLVVGD